MVDMPAPGHLGTGHVLVADAANVVVLFQLIARCVLQAVDLCHSRSTLAERAPPILGLAPDVEVGVDEHHDGPDGAAAPCHPRKRRGPGERPPPARVDSPVPPTDCTWEGDGTGLLPPCPES